MFSLFHRVFVWLVTSFQTKTVSARVVYLENKIDRLHADARLREVELEDSRKRLDVIRQDLEHEMRNTGVVLDNASKEIKRLDEALEATREELRTAREITIPGLVSANQVFIERWQAEIAAQAAKTALSTPMRESE